MGLDGALLVRSTQHTAYALAIPDYLSRVAEPAPRFWFMMDDFTITEKYYQTKTRENTPHPEEWPFKFPTASHADE